MQIELKPIDNVFNYIPSSVRREQNDDSQIKSWALQAWRNVGTPLRYAKNIIFLEVTDHKTVIPDGVNKIINVRLLNATTVEQVESLYECSCEPTAQTTGFADSCSTYYRLFVFSKFYTECFGNLRYIGNWGDNFVCKGGYSTTCSDSYSLNSSHTIIQTSVKDGVIALEYFSEMKDDADNFMLPKQPNVLWQYLSAYVKTRHWEDRMSTKEEGTGSLYQTYLSQETMLLRECRGYFNGKAIRFKNLKGIIYGESEIVRMPQFLLERFNNMYSW